MDLADRHGVEVVVLLAPDLLPCDEVRGFQDREVLHHSEASELGDCFAELTKGQAVLLHQTVEESPARGLCERTEDLVHLFSKGDSRVTCQVGEAARGRVVDVVR